MDNASLLNFTGAYSNIEAQWGNIGKHDLPVFTMNGNFGYFEIGLRVIVAAILCFFLFKLVRCLRARYTRPSADQAGVIRSGVTYHAPRSNPTTVTFALPSSSPSHPSNPTHDNESRDDDRTEPKYHLPTGLSSASDEIEDCHGPPNVHEPTIRPHPNDFVGPNSAPGRSSLPRTPAKQNK